MRLVVHSVVALAVAVSSCDKKKSSSGGSDAASETTATDPLAPTTTQVGTIALATIEGVILPKEGAAATTAVGAQVTAESHPEIFATTDADGKFSIAGVMPGEVALYVASNDGAALAAVAGSQYGLRIPNVVATAGKITDLGDQRLKKTGALKGKVVFYSNPNNLDVTGSEVFVPGTGFIVKTDALGDFLMTGLPPGDYKIRAQHPGFAVQDLEGVKIVEGETSDLGEVTLSLSTGPEGTLVVTPTDLPKIAGEDTKVSTSFKVNFTLTYDQDAALMKISDEPAFINKEWKPVQKTDFLTFTTDGAKRIYVMYSNLNGLESSPFYDDVIVDTKAPVLDSIEILYGFAQSANATNLPVTINARDSGTGIKSVTFSDAFTGTRDFDADHVDVTFTSQVDGPRHLVATVTDYVNRTSNAVFDDINILAATEPGGGSLITYKTYDKPVVLKKLQGPFLMQLSATFKGGLTIEAGTELRLDNGASPNIQSLFTADASGSQPITIKRASPDLSCASPSSYMLLLDSAPPGVSSGNLIKNVHFVQVGIQANGGLITGSSFDSSDCPNSTTHGKIRKTGLETLTVEGNTFNQWDTVMETEAGNANTRVINNNDVGNTIGTALRQGGSAKNTVFTGNRFTGILADQTRGLVEPMNNEAVDYTGTQMTTVGTVVYVPEFTPGDVAVSRLNITACAGIAVVRSGAANANLTITNSTFTNCDTAVSVTPFAMPMDTWEQSSTITFDHNTIAVNRALVYSANAEVPAGVIFTNNRLSCATTGTCDLYYLKVASDPATTPMTLTNNDILCPGAAGAGCRGFTAETMDVGVGPTRSVTINAENNYWNDVEGKSIGAGSQSNLRSVLVIYRGAGSPNTVDDDTVMNYQVQAGGTSNFIVNGFPLDITTLASPVAGAGPQ